MKHRKKLTYAEFALSFLKGKQGRIPLKAITTAYEERTGKNCQYYAYFSHGHFLLNILYTRYKYY